MTTQLLVKTSVYILTALWLVTACSQTRQISDAGKKTEESPAVNTVNTQESVVQGRLDSIDKANNASVIASGDNITRAFVSLKDGDSTISLIANMRQDHRIFGYSKPDTKSERLLLLSVFTNDIENNPYGCKLGSYYDTSGMEGIILKYIETTDDFVKAVAIDNLNDRTILFFEKKWIEVE